MNKTILLGHGSGGLMTSELIKNLFVKYFDNPMLRAMSDSALVKVNDQQLAFTTDSYVIDPIFFPGGDIGKLAVCGTVNDLSVSGATPLYLSSGFIIEEGFLLSDLEKIVQSMTETAEKAGVKIVTGDTKVVKKGQCDKIFINTSGIGYVKSQHHDIASGLNIKPGDQLIVNGFLGDHEIAILAARENLQFEEPMISDVAPLNLIIHKLIDAGIDIRFMRDITRGGLATVLSELTENKKFGTLLDESKVPVRAQVNGICEVFGFDPLYLANEGKFLMVVSADHADSALKLLRQSEFGTNAVAIGSITDINPGKTLMKSVSGGTRMIDRLAGEQLPRIC